MSFEIFDWKGIKRSDDIEMLDDGLVIARGVIEDLASDRSLIRLKQRYGIDFDALATGADWAAALNEAARAKTQAQEERTAAAGENTQAAQLLTEAERNDKAQRESVDADIAQPEQLTDEAAATYDSAERREALAKSLDHISDREAVAARLTADRNQATPPSAAFPTAGSKASTALKARTATSTAKQVQKDLSR